MTTGKAVNVDGDDAEQRLHKRMEYVVVCLGLIACTITSKVTAAGIFTGVCVLIVCCLYVLEVQLVTRAKHALIRSRVRSASSLGLWCTVLLPVCLFRSCHTDPGFTCSETYSTVSLASVVLLVPSIYWMYFAIVKPANSVLVYGFYFCTTVIMSTGIFYNWLIRSTALSAYGRLSLFLFMVVVFDLTLHQVLLRAPNSFTLGEAVLVSQGVAVFFVSQMLNLYHKLQCASDSWDDHLLLEHREVSEFVNTLLVSCAMLVLALFLHEWFRLPTGFYCTAVILGGLSVGPGLYLALGENPAIWLFDFFTSSYSRMAVLCVWVVALVLAFVVLFAVHRSTEVTVVRKYFHVFMLAVYIPGLLYDQPMLYLASTLFCGICVLLECIRVLNIPPLGAVISKGFMTFTDEKDVGPLVLTHIYLLAGCSLPLWMSPHLKSIGSSITSLVVFSGILSVGVGDTIASVFGTIIGGFTWPGTKKTVAGTLSSIVAQFIFCCSMDYLGYVNASLSKYACAVVISSLLEAFTLQIDNLVLPLFFYMMLIV